MTREELLALCDDGIVQEKDWSNRDSSAAQKQLAECRGLIAAGCEFVAMPGHRGQTHNVRVWYRGFDDFEYGTDASDTETYYVPTRETLDANKGGDWY